MAEFIDISELEDKMRENKFNEAHSSESPTNTSMVTETKQAVEIALHNSDKELAELLQEKVQLHEKGAELKTIVSNILDETAKIIEKGEKQEKALKDIEQNEKLIPQLLRNRLSEIHAHCIKVEGYFEKFLARKRDKLRNIRALSGKDEIELEQKLALAESRFTSFNEQVSTIELLMTPDYDIVYREHDDCLNVVMEEFKKVEENLNGLMSVLF